jgi:hypothetical protein
VTGRWRRWPALSSNLLSFLPTSQQAFLASLELDNQEPFALTDVTVQLTILRYSNGLDPVDSLPVFAINMPDIIGFTVRASTQCWPHVCR